MHDLSKVRLVLLCVGCCALTAAASEAQSLWTDKAFVNVSVGGQVGSHTLDSTRPFDLYDEAGKIETSDKVKGGGLFDVSAGYRVWDNLTLGVAYSVTTSQSTGTLTATVPDPSFRDRPRTVSVAGPELSHSENDIHFFGMWMIPLRDKMDLGVSFGPSVLIVKQDLADTVTVTEPGPTISSVSLRKVTKTTAGINAGIDFSYMITKRFGAGALVRYTWGSAGFGSGSEDLTVGGLQVGAGLRIRFDKIW